VALRKNANAGKSSPKNPAVIVFWLIFFIVVICLFLAKRDVITQNIQNLLRGPGTEENESPEIPDPAPETPVPVTGGSSPVSAPPGAAETGPAPAPAAPEGRDSPEPVRPETPEPAGTNVPSGPEAGKNRTIYFMQLDRDGTIIRTRINKTLPASDSPMLDVLQSLLQGPPAEEQRRGLISLIPQGTRIINATVRGETAYINFSEEFQYNTYGVEGYAAQLKQVVWTATEFSNVKDVQILIEGRRVDYLGESVWIGSPLGRDML
jgi:spore germination protein GerM